MQKRGTAPDLTQIPRYWYYSTQKLLNQYLLRKIIRNKAANRANRVGKCGNVGVLNGKCAAVADRAEDLKALGDVYIAPSDGSTKNRDPASAWMAAYLALCKLGLYEIVLNVNVLYVGGVRGEDRLRGLVDK